MMSSGALQVLERGARRALVGLFGEGWCTQEFAALPQKMREALLKGMWFHNSMLVGLSDSGLV